MVPKIEIHDRAIASRKEGVNEWRIAAAEKKALLRFLEELELGKINKGRKISESRQSKYLDVLRTPLEHFGKPTNRLVLKDIEAFEKALSSGAIQSNRDAPYGHATKVDMRRALKVYLRWRLGPAKANKLTDWLDTRDISKTPDFLKVAEIEKLYKSCKSAEERFLIAVLFDSGARAGEFHNIRYEDIRLPEEASNHVKLTLKEEYSKTKGRTISLYWEHSLGAVRDYLHQRQSEGIRSTDPVFDNTYTAARLFLNRLGKKVLGRSIHFHLFRHSSATYFANKMNRQQLCIRYGWAFSSRMPDVYISRAGVDTEELDQKFKATEIEILKTSLTRMEQAAKIKDDRIQQMEGDMIEMRQNVSSIVALIESKPSIEEVEAALNRKRKAEA